MISKNMYKVLKQIPHAPIRTNFKDLDSKKILDISNLKNILMKAISYKYIQYYNPLSPYNQIEKNDFHLTEEGQVKIEEFKNQKGSSAKATWAIIISILSLIVSAIAIILKI